MKIAITGHTSGIGKAIYDYYSPNIIGFSRLTGFDISNPDHRKQIRDNSVDCDVFINNAYWEFAQIYMMYLMYESWANTNKIIINIGSTSPDVVRSKPLVYQAIKAAVDKASDQLSRLNTPCRVVNLRPGYVDTPMVSHITDMPKMSVNSIVHCIDFIINSPQDLVVNSMTVLPRKREWQ